MIAKITVCVLLIGMLCASAAAQSGCGYGVVYGVSGYAASPYDPEPTAATAFQPGLQLAEETYGPANCTFTLTYADWYGYCQIPGFGGNWAGGPGFRMPKIVSAPSINDTCIRTLRVNILNFGCPILDAFQGRDWTNHCQKPNLSRRVTDGPLESSNQPQRLCHPRIVSNL